MPQRLVSLPRIQAGHEIMHMLYVPSFMIMCIGRKPKARYCSEVAKHNTHVSCHLSDSIVKGWQIVNELKDVKITYWGKLKGIILVGCLFMPLDTRQMILINLMKQSA